MDNELNEIKDEDEENNECYCCGYKTEVTLFKANQFMDEVDEMFCDLCASTFISKIYKSKSFDYSIKLLARSVGYIGNEILKAIKEVKG